MTETEPQRSPDVLRNSPADPQLTEAEIVERLKSSQRAFGRFIGAAMGAPTAGPTLADVMRARKTAMLEGLGELETDSVPTRRLPRPARPTGPTVADLVTPVLVIAGVGMAVGYLVGAGWIGAAFGWLRGGTAVEQPTQSSE